MRDLFQFHHSLNCLLAGSRCFFPRAWHGDYFHLGYHQPLQVVNDTISQKGKCVENFGSHFVLEDEEYGEKCWKCLTIYRKHQNVLSYKESESQLLLSGK